MKKWICILCVLCLCVSLPALGGASHVTIDQEGDARALAEAFFASPYVNEDPAGRTLTVTPIERGWCAEMAADGNLPTLTLTFTADGRIQQYENSAYALPSLEGFALEENGSLDEALMLDSLRDALLYDMANNQGGVFAREGDAVFYALDSFSEWLGLVMENDAPKLVAYGDFGTDDAHYPGYLTRGEAAAAAQRALADEFQLKDGWEETLVLMQSNFNMDQRRWTDADIPIPHWFFVFGDQTDGMKSQYEALIDAETGDVLELHDPSTSGNG